MNIDKKVFDEMSSLVRKTFIDLYTEEGLEKMTPQEKTEGVRYLLKNGNIENKEIEKLLKRSLEILDK